jgi:F-type H+-transporting ATPase subunit delta
MVASKIANPYAEAFFQLCINLSLANENFSDIFYAFMFDIERVYILLSENPQLLSFLKNPLNSNEVKKSVLSKCLDRRTSLYTINFLNLLIDKKRINVIEIICEKFLAKVDEFLCIKFIEVSSPIELEPDQEERLIKKITKMIGPVFTRPFFQPAVVKLIIKIDPKILGGLIIKIGSKVIDFSLRGELQRIAKEMAIVM